MTVTEIRAMDINVARMEFKITVRRIVQKIHNRQNYQANTMTIGCSFD